MKKTELIVGIGLVFYIVTSWFFLATLFIKAIGGK